MSENYNLVKELKSKLFFNKRNGFSDMPVEEFEKTQQFAIDYKKFLDVSKTEREFISKSLKNAKDLGFVEFDKNQKYNPGDKVYLVNRNKALALAVIGENGTKKGVKLCIAHVDSPRMDLKPNPLYESNELALFKTHYYGGVKKYQWTCIPLSLHGKIIKNDGSEIEVLLGENDDDPCFCITDLLPHLASTQMSKTMKDAINGEQLNILVGSRPLVNEQQSDLVKLNILNLLNDKYGITEKDFISAELELVPAFKARDVGFDKSMIGAYGQDDKCCAYAALAAVLNCSSPKNTVITYLCDKEEIGSDGNTGMKSLFLEYFIADLANLDNLSVREVLSKSECLSADVSAAYDPTFSDVFDQYNSCHINKGVVVTKYTGSRGKSGTSDASAEYMSKILAVFDKNNILWQTGELGKVDAGGGGTIAQFIANLNVDTIDVGIPVLSMHSPFEVISKVDLYLTFKAFLAFYNNF